MASILQQRNEARENQAHMIMEMERKLNPSSAGWFKFMNRRDQSISRISVAQYWDMLYYIDDDYLTDYEVLKMKELYAWQLQELSGQFVLHTAVGWGMCFPLMGPIIKSATHGWYLRLPVALSFATFLGVQASSWERPSQSFHDLMCQPAPHGSYLRRSIKEHFPVWWNSVSANLHA